MTQKQKDNLRQLAEYCIKGELKADFDMTRFCDRNYITESAGTTCGTVGCFAGHGPYAGIPKDAMRQMIGGAPLCYV